MSIAKFSEPGYFPTSLAAMADALIKAVSIFDREELPSTAELGAVFQALGKPQPEQVRHLIARVAHTRPGPSHICPCVCLSLNPQ